MRLRSVLPLALLVLGSAQAARLTVYAASSLTDAFTEIGRAFDAASGNVTTFNFAGSQALRTQLEQGARADVYASANSAQLDPLVKAGLLEPGGMFTMNRLVVIAPRGNSKVNTLKDLAAPGVALVLADQAVPVGAASRAALEAITKAGSYGADFAARVLKNVVSEEPNVRQVALKVGLGQGDAAIVYVSDLTPSLKRQVRTIGLPSRFNPPVRYPIGVLKASPSAEAARAFVAFVRSARGQAILKKWGFLELPELATTR